MHSELTHLIKARPLPGETIVIEADAAQRAALAERFALAGIDSLRAQIDLVSRGSAIRATGTLVAEVQQICAISGEAFPARIETPVDLRFVEQRDTPHAEHQSDDIEIELEADDCDEIEYTGDAFDLGEAVAQTLGLAIDPYAEGPDADAVRKAEGIIEEGQQSGPLADALAALKKS